MADELDGQAVALQGDRQVKIKGGHELALNADPLGKTKKFDKSESEQSDLYRWSSLRSSYLAEANAGTWMLNRRIRSRCATKLAGFD